MKNDTVVTVGRQFGSGGREIGKALAEKLDIPFYDRDLIAMAAEKSGYNHDILESADEKTGNAFLQSFAMTSFSPGGRISLPTEISINDKLFFAQAEIIKSLADKGSCVIVGRCADYVLRDRENCANIFIHASLEKRVRRVARLYCISDTEAKNIIQKTDKKRASYYNYYSNKEWSNVASYDLSINSACLGVEGSTGALLEFVRQKDEIAVRPEI